MQKLIGNSVVIMALLGGIPAVDAVAAPQKSSQQRSPAKVRLCEGIQLLAEGEAAEAAAILGRLVAEADPDLDRGATLIAAGKAYLASDAPLQAQDAFESALEFRSKPAEVAVLRLAAADAALRGQQYEAAISHCQQTLRMEPSLSQRRLAVRTSLRAQVGAGKSAEAVHYLNQVAGDQPSELIPLLGDEALRMGTASLQSKQLETALASYQWYLKNLPEGPSRQVAELGAAWAAALGAERPEKGAERLQQFLQHFPDSPDLPAVLQAEAACWRKAGEHDKANQALRRLVIATPGTTTARHALDQLSAEPHVDNDPAVQAARRHLIRQADEEEDIPANIVAAGIKDAADQSDEDAWQAVLERALAHAAVRVILTDALDRLMRSQHDAYAERLAAQVLTRMDQPAAAPALDAVAIWAADSGRWSMLALASADQDPTAVVPQLGATATRLIAEALMQGGKTEQAKTWFDLAVETHQLHDFASLLRRAELAVALDPIAVAEQRLEIAKAAANGPADQAVIEILTAETLVRQAKLDESRAILQRIVRGEDATAELRCRAQWLIGEAFLMQQRYAEAVDAYRRVELLEGSLPWVPVALVQAGKAFEKMGRSREAAMCYSGLIQRFADSEHAVVARDRLASMRETTTLR